MALAAITMSNNIAVSSAQTTQEEEADLENLEIEEVDWSASNSQAGLATGKEWEWQIDKISLDPGANLIKLIVRDVDGNIAEKEIEVVYHDILAENGTKQLKQWARRLTYEFKFDDTDFSEETPTEAFLTVWLWPDRIIMTDDYLNPDNIDTDRIITEDGLKCHWSIKCDKSNENILYLDIPSN